MVRLALPNPRLGRLVLGQLVGLHSQNPPLRLRQVVVASDLLPLARLLSRLRPRKIKKVAKARFLRGRPPKGLAPSLKEAYRRSPRLRPNLLQKDQPGQVVGMRSRRHPRSHPSQAEAPLMRHLFKNQPLLAILAMPSAKMQDSPPLAQLQRNLNVQALHPVPQPHQLQQYLHHQHRLPSRRHNLTVRQLAPLQQHRTATRLPQLSRPLRPLRRLVRSAS